jgi:hypothetical protein
MEHEPPSQPPRGFLYRFFIAHPKTAGECYWRHLWFSLKTGAQMIFYALCLILHGFLPFLCEKTASNFACRLYDDMQARRRRAGCDD